MSSSRLGSRPGVLLVFAVGTVGCVPDLKSPPWAGDVWGDASSWEAPENRWDYLDGPPSDLESEGYQQGDVFPNIELVDQHGDTVSFWQFYGMVIALDISTMWCGPCRGLAKEVDHTWKDYRDEGFIYLTMLPENLQGQPPDRNDLNQWANEFDITAPVLSDRPGYSYDIAPDGGWPRILVIGRDMRVTEPQVSPPEDAAIRTAIEAAL